MQQLYSHSVRGGLAGLYLPGVVADIAVYSELAQWKFNIELYRDKVVGIILCEIVFSLDCLTLFSAQQRDMQMHWTLMGNKDVDGALFVKVIDACFFGSQIGHAILTQHVRSRVLNRLSPHCLHRLRQLHGQKSQQDAPDVIQGWKQELNDGQHVCSVI